MYTGCNLWETHVSCRVLLDTIHISFCIFFCSYYPSFRIAWIRICFSFSLFRSLPFFLPFRYFFFIWTVVHLIGCTGLLGTDNWLANNSSNNIRAYDIQVLIYTLHRYFFVFVFRSNHIFGACSVCLRECTCLYLRTSADMLPDARCSVMFWNVCSCKFIFFRLIDICQIRI